jgi:hypothetical protein
LTHGSKKSVFLHKIALCQKLPSDSCRAGWSSWRGFDPSSSPSATLAEATYSPRQFLGNLSPITAAISHLNSGLLLGRACLIVLRKAHLSPKLCTPRLRYGSRNSNVSKSLRISTKRDFAALLGQARASEANSQCRGLNPSAPASHSRVRRTWL